MIPDEIRSIKQWSHSFSPSELKRPAHYDYVPNGGLDYGSAVSLAESNNFLTGFYVTDKDVYVLGDIDHVADVDDPWADVPVELTMLLRTHPTYVESSPSGKGLRFIYKLPVGEKQKTTGNYYLLRKDAQGDFKPKWYQINFGKPWMTITGRKVPWSASDIQEVTLSDLEQVFTVRYADKKKNELADINFSKMPSLPAVLKTLKTIPMDGNPRVVRAHEQVFDEGYTPYGFWIKIMMTLHHYASVSNSIVECLQAVTEWSRSDPEGYTSDEDVLKHWASLSSTESSITYRSLYKIALANTIRWPRPRLRIKKEVERNTPYRPLLTEYANFKAMIEFYRVKVYRSSLNPNVLYLYADQDIVDKYFMMYNVKEWLGLYGPFTKDTLTPALYVLAQDVGFIGMTHGQMNQFIKTYLSETTQVVDTIRLYFDIPFADLPPKYKENEKNFGNSSVDYLFEAFDIEYQTNEHDKEFEFYRSCYKIWLLGFIRNMYYADSRYSNNCVLLLTGPEQIRKTSHFRYLFPSFLREHIAFTTHGFSTEGGMRDVTKLASTSLILVWDEIEQYLTADTESNFKKIIDGMPQKIIDKYETIPVTIQPRCMYGATSNLREFKLGDEGSRRLFHIPVKWVDTDHMDTVCWHSLISKLHEEVKFAIKSGDIPWLLTQEQLEYQSSLHKNIRSRTTLDFALEELFRFDVPKPLRDGGSMAKISSIQSDTSGLTMTTKDISDMLTRYGFGYVGIKRPALVKTLERLCGDYTGTKRYGVFLVSPKCKVYKGMATQGNHKRWIVPPLRRSIKDVARLEFKDVIQQDEHGRNHY